MLIWKALGDAAETQWGVTFTDAYRSARSQPGWNINKTSSYSNLIKDTPDIAIKACEALETRATQAIEACSDLELLKDPSAASELIFGPLRRVVRDSLNSVAHDCASRGLPKASKVQDFARDRADYISVHIDSLVSNVAERMRFRAQKCERERQEFTFKQEQHRFAKVKFRLDWITGTIAVGSAVVAIIGFLSKQSWISSAVISAISTLLFGIQQLSSRRSEL